MVRTLADSAFKSDAESAPDDQQDGYDEAHLELKDCSCHKHSGGSPFLASDFIQGIRKKWLVASTNFTYFVVRSSYIATTKWHESVQIIAM